MDISVRTEGPYTVEDRSWLGSAHGTTATRSIVIDPALFTKATHFPAGYLKSGTWLAQHDDGRWGPYGGRTSEVQTATITGGPTGGTWTLTVNGETTAGIAYNATAAVVQDALQALPGISTGDITVTGATPVYTLTFGGEYAGDNVAAVTASGASLTGGSTPGVTITTATAGGATVTTGLDRARGVLFDSVRMAEGGAKLMVPLQEHGMIVVSNLPANHGLDAAAREDLRGQFIFR